MDKPVPTTTVPPNRKERRRQLQSQQQKVDAVVQETSAKPIARRLFSNLFFWLICAVTVAGFLFFAYPRLSVHPGQTVSPGDPFQADFVLKNDGYLPIDEITYSLTLEYIAFGKGNTLPRAYSGINETRVEGLAARRSSPISLNPFVSLLKQSFGIVLPPKTVTSAEMYVDVAYRAYLIPYTFKKRVYFKTAVSSTGTYTWLEYQRSR